MKLYLSSYKLGDDPNKFAELFGNSKNVGLISNALDFSKDIERLHKSQQDQIDSLKSIGISVEVIDLKMYFGKIDELSSKLSSLDGLWVRGGNVFVLAVAYNKSGLDLILKNNLIKRKDFVYGGFSAGCCILQKSFKGLDFVDDPYMIKDAYGDDTEIIWEGVGLLDYAFVPHYRSDHPESADIEKEVDYYKKNNIKYKALRDGEVIIDEIF
jgi:dipeptidase E